MSKAFVIICAVTSLTLLLASQVKSESIKTTRPETLYRIYIDELILKCDSKAGRHNSKCENIRRESELYRLKADFFRSNKVQLIRGMVAEDVGERPHQMHYYLNRKFFDSQLNQ